MKYKKINDATVQCIITQDDMVEYGLTLSDIFERNEKGEEFLRDVIERAYDEVGYKISSGNIAMQITPLKDKGLVVTFTDESPSAFQEILRHLKEVLQDVGAEMMNQSSAACGQENLVDNAGAYGDENRRIFAFAHMWQVMRYAATVPSGVSVKGNLYKEGDAYYLILEKGRLSRKNFNKICAQAVEFGMMMEAFEERINYLEEHGECLIANRAISRLRRIYLAK